MSKLPHVHASVVHMLADTAARVPTRTALVCGSERLSYGRYLGCVAEFSEELIKRGARGERVAILLGNGIDICIAMFAIHAAGATAVPLNPGYTERELTEILQDADVRVLLFDEHSDEVARKVGAGLGIEHLIGLGELDDRHLLGLDDDRGLLLPEPLPPSEATASLQYTGGTTGRSKGVELTHAAIAYNISQREALVPTRRDQDRLLSVMPLFHVYAINMCLHLACYSGATLVIVPRYTPQAVCDALIGEDINVLAGSPTLYAGLLGFEGFEQLDTSTLEICYSGGAALPTEILRRWEARTGSKVVEGYGQTEAGPVVSFNPQDGIRKPGSVGIPVPDTQVEIVDVETGEKVLPPGERGEIRLRGPQVMRGYRNLPQETAQAIRDGWLYTGDIGEFDEDGYLYIRDRKKDMVIVSGFNVYPREVEEVLYQHEAVREAAVVGAKDDYRGELLKAVVALKDNTSASEDELIAHCAEQLIKYKVPGIIELVDELPKTGAGKIDKKPLRD